MNNNLKTKLQNFFDMELNASIEYILCGCIAKDNLGNMVSKYIDLFSKECKYEILEQSLTELYENTNQQINKFKNEIDLQKKFDQMMYTRGIFSLLEGTVENSLLTKNVIKLLKREYGSKYIEKISIIDRKYLSEDTLTFLNKRECTDMTGVSNSVKTYLLLKRFQDITHKAYLDLTNKIFKEFNDNIIGDLEFKNDFLKEQYIKDFYLKSKLQKKPATLSEIAKYISYGFDNNVRQIFGGKAYGLGVLELLNQDVPNAICYPIDYDYDNMDTSIFSNQTNYSVRSSANIEDGENNSFAGMFDSYLNIKKEEIAYYCKKVLNSVNNKRAIDYVNKFKLDTPQMAVIVQEYKEPVLSGIWMGIKESSGLMEYTSGSGEKIVSGHVLPNQEQWDISTSNSEYLKTNKLFVGKYLLQLQNKIFRQYNVLPDFEWCVVENKIKILQFRNVTTKIIVNNEENIIHSQNVTGIPCSSGCYEGIAQFIRNPEQLDILKPTNILLSLYTDPDWISGMNRAGAIITAMGGFLCHAAIIARELKIPCITGIGIENLKTIKDKYVKMNGNTGVITIVENC